jgi:DNA-binding NtrC family response regulator
MSAQQTKIVIIDDEADLCFLLSGMLTTYGYTVVYFHTLQSGIEGVRNYQPDWVIIDNNLPDGLGWAVADEFLAIDEKMNLLKISANPDSLRADNRYNVHYMIKPIKVQAIVDLIEQHKY